MLLEKIHALYDTPFMALLHEAHTIHLQNHDPNAIQISTLLSVKTGACPEDCAYCPQSVHFDTKLEREKLMDLDKVKAAAQAAKDSGASRFCMGLAWRTPPSNSMFNRTLEMVKTVKSLGLETCMTMGMLTAEHAQKLKESGLDYYNHNIDSSPEYYEKVITTRTFQDRIDTLNHVAQAGLNVCCGGIVGMGESRQDRARFFEELSKLPRQPDSIPINRLVRVKGTPLEDCTAIDAFEFIKTIAVARILFPKSMVRLSAGRETMNDEMQALCFYAGANSIFYGEKLLTTANPEKNQDDELMRRLNLKPMKENHAKPPCQTAKQAQCQTQEAA